MRRLARTSSVPVKRFRATPEAWIAPSASRELRELVRHRAKLVRLRSSLKCQRHDSGYAAVQTIPGMGLTLGAVSVAEIGDVRRFPRTDAADQLGRSDLTPRHRESATAVHGGRITKQGSRRCTASIAADPGAGAAAGAGRRTPRPQRPVLD
jgi:transposase